MCFKGAGVNFPEALDDFLAKTGMADSPVVRDLMDFLKSSPPVSPLYVGVNVKHTVGETLEYLKMFNDLNKQHLTQFLPFLDKTDFHTQSFLTPSVAKEPSTPAEGEAPPVVPEDQKVTVLKEADEVVLLDHFHVTLYFLGMDKKPEEMVKEDVDKVAKYLKDSKVDFQLMLKTLTLYEFSVCLMYRYLYKMPLPFEKTPRLPAESEETHEQLFLRYLVLVPGVVFFAIVELPKPLFAIPPKDFHAHEETVAPEGSKSEELDKLLQSLKGKVLVENYHSTHITLGTSHEYKAVISNQMCLSLLHFLETNKGTNVHTFSSLKAAASGSKKLKKQVFDKDLSKYLKVFNSGPCKFGNLKDAFLKSLPFLLTHLETGTETSNETVTLPESTNLRRLPPQFPSFSEDMETKTKVYVSDDYKWFYFNNLSATHTLPSDTTEERYDWLVDMYVVAFDKEVSGNMHFNQK